MNEKIENLMKELKSECQKQGVSIICTALKEKKSISAIYGDPIDISFCLAIQEEKLEEILPVPAYIARRIGIESMEEVLNKKENQSTNHTFVIDNEEDLADVMTRILKGEFE